MQSPDPPALVDAHTHVVSEDLAAYPLKPGGLPGSWYREAPHNAEALIAQMDVAGVARAVIVQGVGAYSYDNRYAADSAQRHAARLSSVCCIDVLAPDALDTLDHLVRDRGMQGIRLFALSREATSWLDDERTFPVWERATALGAHVVVTILFHQLPQLRTALARFPDTVVSLDHCAFPPLSTPPWSDAEPLFTLADHANLHLKITTNVLDGVKAAGGDPREAVASLVRRFGAERILWGSDFCQTHDRSYPELVAWARHCFGALSADEQAACLGGTAQRFFR